MSNQKKAEALNLRLEGTRSEMWLFTADRQFIARCKHHQPGKSMTIILDSIKKEWKGDVQAFINFANETSPSEAADMFRKKFPERTDLHRPDVRPLPGRVVA